MAPETPVIFISHATADEKIARVWKSEIERMFADQITVFLSSDAGSMTMGAPWFENIWNSIKSARAVVVIITRNSARRPWIWFEIGASWFKLADTSIAYPETIYPLCAPGTDLSALPEPLGRLTAVRWDTDDNIKQFFETLHKQFDKGRLASLDICEISKRLEIASSQVITVSEKDDTRIYVSPYEDWSDDELVEIVDERFFAPHWPGVFEVDPWVSTIWKGQLVMFDEVDAELSLPPGTAKRILKRAAERYDLEPFLETDKLIRFQERSKKTLPDEEGLLDEPMF